MSRALSRDQSASNSHMQRPQPFRLSAPPTLFCQDPLFPPSLPHAPSLPPPPVSLPSALTFSFCLSLSIFYTLPSLLPPSLLAFHLLLSLLTPCRPLFPISVCLARAIPPSKIFRFDPHIYPSPLDALPFSHFEHAPKGDTHQLARPASSAYPQKSPRLPAQRLHAQYVLSRFGEEPALRKPPPNGARTASLPPNRQTSR